MPQSDMAKAQTSLITTAMMILQFVTVAVAGDPVFLRRSGFEQLREGAAADGGQNLYVSRQGRVQTINRLDFNLDGEIDLLFTQDHDSVYTPDSLIYWGSTDGFRSLLPEMWRMRAPFSLLTWLDQTRSAITRLPTMGGGRAKITDLNGDGHPDIVFANFMHNYRPDQNSQIYWGSDSGFSPMNRTELPSFLASGVAVGDLNGDGLPEVVLSNRGDERGESWGYHLHLESWIYWGSADGFHPTRRTSVPTISAADVAMGDFNGDTAPDLAFVNFNREEQSAYVYFNDGNGDFDVAHRQILNREALRLTTFGQDRFGQNRGMQTLVATQLNGDHFADLVIGGTEKAVVYYGQAEGLNVEQCLELPADNCKGIATADLNRDGRPEIVLANEGPGFVRGRRQPGSDSTIFWASEQGFDETKRTDLPTLGSATVQVADLNGDETPDILFGNSRDAERNDVPSYIYWGSPDGYASWRRQELTGFGTIGSGVADLNRDGRTDVLLVSHLSGNNTTRPAVIFWGNSGHHYSSASATILEANPHMEYSVADLDDDGFPDLLFLSDRSMHANIMWGSPAGFSARSQTELPVRNPMSSSVADLNRDGWLDIVYTVPGSFRDAEKTNARTVILWGNEKRFDGARTYEFELSAPGTEANSIADLNRDGHLDLIFPLGNSETSEIWYGSQKGYQRENSERLPASGSPHAVSADLDRDGWLDLVFTSGADTTRYTVNTPTFIYWGSPQGFAVNPPTELEGYAALDASIADFNRDGHLDIAMSNYKSNTNRRIPTFLYWGDGSRNYNAKRRTLLSAASGAAIDALDLNRDGWPELIVSNHQKNFDHGLGGTDIFWGGQQGFAGGRRTNLPTVGVHLDAMVDAGNIYDRKQRWEYIFEPVDAPQNTLFARFHWNAETNHGTAITFQVRSASQKNMLTATDWHGPTGPKSFYRESPAALVGIPAEHRWLQYRAIFTSPDGANTAYLREIAVECTQ
ncbi:MAG: VCBS repeat-containing protein [Fuerstiella sp.]|nr:VCBS repeat-containing protein [Fuerstiella sp.]